ncbi:hypothetical protein METHPM2_1300019 [Pseudomonas sp. PM2]
MNSWVTRQDAGLAAPRHGWRVAAAHGFKPAFGHTEPERGAEWWGKSPFGYFWGSFPKVTRCQSGTLGGRYLNNGYVPGLTALTIRPSSQASQLPHLDCGASGRSVTAVKPSGEQAPSPQDQRRTEVV